MKHLKLLSASLCALSLATVASPVSAATSSNFVKQVGIAHIANIEGVDGARVYSAPGKNPTNRVLPIYSNWKTLGYTMVNGTKWFNVGTNQWINSSATTFSTSATGPQYYGTKNASGIVKINYKPGYGVAVWSTPGHNATGKYLPSGSSWKYFKTAEYNGYLWYNLGGNQWVSAQYAVSNNPTAVAKYVIAKRSIVKVTNPKGAKVYSDPNSATSTGRVLPSGSRWKSFKILNNGVIWYNLGGNQWISETDTF